MKRSSRQSRRARVVMFEALQPRELMAVDAFPLGEGYTPYLTKVTEARQASGEGPDDSPAFAFIPKAHPADEALVSLPAGGYGDQDDIILRAKKSRS